MQGAFDMVRFVGVAWVVVHLVLVLFLLAARGYPRVDSAEVPQPSVATTDDFPDWCLGNTCDDDDSRFRADKAPDDKGAERK